MTYPCPRPISPSTGGHRGENAVQATTIYGTLLVHQAATRFTNQSNSCSPAPRSGGERSRRATGVDTSHLRFPGVMMSHSLGFFAVDQSRKSVGIDPSSPDRRSRALLQSLAHASLAFPLLRPLVFDNMRGNVTSDTIDSIPTSFIIPSQVPFPYTFCVGHRGA